MKMKERGKGKEAHWKYWDLSRGWSIHFPLLPLIHVMNHHWLHPHLSLSDRGRPQSNIHTPRTRSYFSIALHPWLSFSPSFTLLPSFFPRLKFSLLFSAASPPPPVPPFQILPRFIDALKSPSLIFPTWKIKWPLLSIPLSKEKKK